MEEFIGKFEMFGFVGIIRRLFNVQVGLLSLFCTGHSNWVHRLGVLFSDLSESCLDNYAPSFGGGSLIPITVPY